MFKTNMRLLLPGLALAGSLMITGCQKMERPAMGDYPKDSNPPGGPLKFFVAFDGSTTNPLMNAVDSIRANFAADNPLQSVAGISGKAVQGENKKFIKYAKPNDWAREAKSFTISFWYKRDGQTKNNTGGNGPEYIMSFKSSNGHWSGSNLLVFLEGNNTAGQVKVMMADKSNPVKDGWFTWEGGNSIPGLLNNQWHHIALVYNASNKTMILYVDGVANPNTRSWGHSTDFAFDDSKITEMRVGSGPQDNINSDDWLSSTYKGTLDQLRLYTSALTASEVSALFSGKK
ncbi:MAG: LamG domain-containing protein [Chitinophagaceae bacterium]|nr:LamG domain-containing protein [Chitinophagaceae bacterium]